jgi:hypothetical protein
VDVEVLKSLLDLLERRCIGAQHPFEHAATNPGPSSSPVFPDPDTRSANSSKTGMASS